MSVYQCRTCGAPLPVTAEPIVECEYCHNRQPVPSADSEKKQALFARANRLRLDCEFDRAAAVYESIMADFPQEAEASWGMVLCRYGIEYVDDPATGKKVPTCHRSSYTSVWDDADCQQTLDCAGPLARKLYHREAAQIEELRERILAASSREEPYDIFICYKETDAKGGRTLDSVLAQDIYDLLTAKGYRVFFSRISLEDKLGQEYEPCIFAALNSAKIMLAVGTCFEHYDAVWVKNEWSRFLKLMETNKTKHLIPCYKDLDAYEIPKEFRRLQAQDLGKVGAHQDLLRGIEKLLPRQTEQVKETVVVQQVVAAGSSIDSRLDRGYLALEDQEWKKADGFFEEVLNNDSRNAHAYLGKVLAEFHYQNLAELEKRSSIDKLANSTPDTLYIPYDSSLVNKIVEQYTVPGYLDEEKLRKLYNMNRGYPSAVQSYRTRRRLEERFWKDDRRMSRVLQFAQGTLKQELEAIQDRILKLHDSWIAKAESQENAQRERVQKAWDGLEATAQRLHREACEKREKDYNSWVRQAQTERDLHRLQVLADQFSGLGNYQDSAALAAQCRKRFRDLNEEHMRRLEEQRLEELARAQAKRLAEEQALAKAISRQNTIKTLIGLAAAAAVLAVLVLFTVVIPNNKYEQAVQLMEAGDYVQAAELFEDLGNREDSLQRYQECSYQHALELYAARDFENALTAFEDLQDYQNSADYCTALRRCILAEPLRQAQVGDTVHFASYNSSIYSDERSPIPWLVLDIQDGKMLLLSNTYLSKDHYHVVLMGEPVWETCSIRERLNAQLINKFFTEEEKELILLTDITTEANPEFGTAGGPDTQDRLFLLSYNEVMQYLPEPEDRLFDGNEWLLRNLGKDSDRAVCVETDGTINLEGSGVIWDAPTRFAMWVDISEPNVG